MEKIELLGIVLVLLGQVIMNNSDYQGKKVMRVKLDATREHINNGDYSPVEYTLAYNTLLSTDASSLADVGEEAVALLHISSSSSALAHQEYFVHSLKIQLEAHTHSYILRWCKC
jgi:hypothetical protein